MTHKNQHKFFNSIHKHLSKCWRLVGKIKLFEDRLRIKLIIFKTIKPMTRFAWIYHNGVR